MRNTLFRRQFLLTAGLILLSFILLAASFTALSYRYMVREKKESMEENVSYAASMTQVILQRGFDPAEDAFPIYGPALSHISDSDLVLCDASGTVLRYIADGADDLDYVGSTISSDVTSQMIQNGIYSGMSDLGIYSGVHFAAGAPIFLQTGQGDSMQYFICMTCGRVSPLSTQSTFEDLAVDFEGTTASGAERFYRRTLDKLRLKLLESGVIHTVTLKQTDMRKKNKRIAAAVYQYQADNDGEWGEIRFDFENGTAEIVRLADWDTVKSNIFANTAIRFVQCLPEARLLKSVVVPFEMGVPERPLPLTKAAKESNGNSSHTISLRQTECRKTGETITAAVYEYLVDNDGEWGELRFDFENGTAEIVRLADWDTVKSNVFAKTAIRYIQGLPEARLLKSVAVPFWKGRA